ncbi:MAG: polymerase subunit delta [Candidatus Peribacteria bacterium]|nr:polymerase subunit delta [Candidatus Peribacteria bacterium]
MSTIFLFTGENSYALRQEKHKWMREFSQKHGQENLQRLDGKGLSFHSLLDEVSALPFIAGKRLLIVTGIPAYSKEEMEVLPESVHPDCLLLFIDPKPDKRLSSTKSLLKIATVKEFPPIAPGQLKQWMQQYVQANGKTIQPAAQNRLLEIVGEDQDALSQELDKIQLYAGDSIEVKHVDILAVPSGEQEVWTLTNTIAAGKKNDALQYAQLLLTRGEDAYSLWSILLWMLKNTFLVFVAVQDGIKNPATIASEYGVPFPSVKSLLPFVSSARRAHMENFIRWAVATDIELKTGGYKSTQEAPEELVCLIDQFIIRSSALSAR